MICCFLFSSSSENFIRFLNEQWPHSNNQKWYICLSRMFIISKEFEMNK
jgi:hypothetical protein